MAKLSPVLNAMEHVLPDGSLFVSGELPPYLRWDDATFNVIWALHPEQKQRIMIHGREVETPRWQQAYGLDYHYTGRTNRALPIPHDLRPLLAFVKDAIDARLNGILLNWYDGPQHYIGPHHDSTIHILNGAPIVTVSFGEARTFRLTRGKTPSKQVLDFAATDGTVFVMPYLTNLAWKHEVPKSTRNLGRRISVTFRGFST